MDPDPSSGIGSNINTWRSFLSHLKAQFLDNNKDPNIVDDQNTSIFYNFLYQYLLHITQNLSKDLII